MAAAPDSGELELEHACARCRELHDRIAGNPSLPRHHPALGSLLRLVAAELRFLDSRRRRREDPDPTTAPAPPPPLSTNLPHLEALHLLLSHPAVRCPSRLAPLRGVDFACAFRSRPAWAILSARNPSSLAWAAAAADGVRARVAAVMESAREAPPATRPEKLLLVFARGVGADPARGLVEEFGAVEIDLLADFVGDADDGDEEGWVSVRFSPSEDMRRFRAFEIDVAECDGNVLSPPPATTLPPSLEMEVEESGVNLDGGFSIFMGKMRMGSRELVNLDTTALVAIVSGISNGGVGKLMSIPESETRARFKCNYKFVMDQAHSELQSPVLVELGNAVDGKKWLFQTVLQPE
uniref:DUF1308 domain-containing protein n=1 Tax=Leersia perrieri TaxID=77586 RepID=A0A0D9XKY1_9ORYZ